ncbi:hypothetical protein PIB30_055053 [Stylosanthes scabra]|uniref:Uncharacterized protein n=1 Tax=Stylosanthes scabra TaxID=79078 RepID=A0ABU6WIT8_9FABA|nr:hypothetical protein [Stylosanthes scabra]
MVGTKPRRRLPKIGTDELLWRRGCVRTGELGQLRDELMSSFGGEDVFGRERYSSVSTRTRGMYFKDRRGVDLQGHSDVQVSYSSSRISTPEQLAPHANCSGVEMRDEL